MFFNLFRSIVFLTLICLKLHADEGMWVYNNLPLQQLKDRYGFEVTEEWKTHLMKSSVRFNSGGSGSFISSTGLVLTNHHVGADTLQKISTAEKDYYTHGYYAKSLEQEVPAKDLELNQLQSIEDVTARVHAAVKAGMSNEDAAAARRAVISEIESESLSRTGLRSDVVTLYQGGQYHLYRYKRYTDVRLVFAPEKAIAFLGGDPDNFEYPRYDLDMCIFRVYEDGKPASINDYLKWSTTGAAEGDLVFVSGHPGRTNRMYSTAALEFLRNDLVGYMVNWLHRRENVLQLYRQLGEEQERQAQADFFRTQNSRKAYLGMLKGLQEESFFVQKQQEEYLLQASVDRDPKLVELKDAWDKLEKAQKAHKKIFLKHSLLESGRGFDSRLFRIARTLVRLAKENTKPNEARLPEYRESNRPSLEQALYSTAPIYNELEVALLANSLTEFAGAFGYDNPLVREVLGGRSASVVARHATLHSALGDVEVRKRIAQKGIEGIRNSHDPMIRMALAVDKRARALEKQYQETVAEVEKQAYAQIAGALFALKGTSTYPDATFTLRLAFGTVKGYEDAEGATVRPITTLGGAFDHEAAHGAMHPWALPTSWRQAKSSLDLKTPFNFVSTADIIGGNSGSPVVNRNGELVGLIFDGNIESLTANYLYEDVFTRAVAVHSAGMLETMSKVYGATALVKEIGR